MNDLKRYKRKRKIKQSFYFIGLFFILFLNIKEIFGSNIFVDSYFGDDVVIVFILVIILEIFILFVFSKDSKINKKFNEVNTSIRIDDEYVYFDGLNDKQNIVYRKGTWQEKFYNFSGKINPTYPESMELSSILEINTQKGLFSSINGVKIIYKEGFGDVKEVLIPYVRKEDLLRIQEAVAQKNTH